MKLKYYLRGLGLGILFTTIILMIAFHTHPNDISDDEVIRRAKKLGMVEQNNGLGTIRDLQNSQEQPDTESVPDTQVQPDTTVTEVTEQTGQSQNVNKNSKNNGGWRQFGTQMQDTSASETAFEQEDANAASGTVADAVGDGGDNQNSPVSVTGEADRTVSQQQDASNTNSSVDNEGDYKLVVKKGDGCRAVAETLMAEGIIEDSEDFRNYMNKRGLDNKLSVGEFTIPREVSYKKLAKILTNQ